MKKLNLILLLASLAFTAGAQSTNLPSVLPVGNSAPTQIYIPIFTDTNGNVVIPSNWKSGGSGILTNGIVSNSRNWTNTTGFDIEVILTNSASVAIFNSAGTNVIPASLSPSNFSLPNNYWITNLTGSGLFYNSP